jgi:malonyl-CoA O-methyltransferase
MNKGILEKNFSRYARRYDRYAAIQDRIAAELIESLGGHSFSDILDIGCGTGNYTGLLRKRFPEARITAIDISGEMLRVAEGKLKEGVRFIRNDAEAIDTDNRFDLISSNAAFQWFENLNEALNRYKGLLSGGGRIQFSTFGPSTFHELNSSVKDLFGHDESIGAGNFTGERRLEDILRRLFRDAEFRIEIYKEEYASLKELLLRIKYTGTRGEGAMNGKAWTKGKLESLERVYRERFGSITATYQVFFCGGTR